MRKLIAVMSAVICALTLCACSAEVASEKEIIEFAQECFGDSTHLSTENVSEDKTVCYFSDTEYGFQYQVTSAVHPVGMDGSTFWYQEGRGSNFGEVYYSFMQEQCGIKGGAVMADGTEIKPFGYIGEEIQIDVNAAESGVEAACTHAEELRDSLKALDTRGYWKNISCTVFDEDGGRYLTYDALHEAPLTPEDENIIYYTEMARLKLPEAEFVRTETGLFSETGLTEDDIPNILGTEKPTADSVVTYYYFKAEGREFFLADFNAFENGDHQTFFWYNNISEVFPEKDK